jgi:hypothetical protein
VIGLAQALRQDAEQIAAGLRHREHCTQKCVARDLEQRGLAARGRVADRTPSSSSAISDPLAALAERDQDLLAEPRGLVMATCPSRIRKTDTPGSPSRRTVRARIQPMLDRSAREPIELAREEPPGGRAWSGDGREGRRAASARSYH